MFPAQVHAYVPPPRALQGECLDFYLGGDPRRSIREYAKDSEDLLSFLALSAEDPWEVYPEKAWELIPPSFLDDTLPEQDATVKLLSRVVCQGVLEKGRYVDISVCLFQSMHAYMHALFFTHIHTYEREKKRIHCWWCACV